MILQGRVTGPLKVVFDEMIPKLEHIEDPALLKMVALDVISTGVKRLVISNLMTKSLPDTVSNIILRVSDIVGLEMSDKDRRKGTRTLIKSLCGALNFDCLKILKTRTVNTRMKVKNVQKFDENTYLKSLANVLEEDVSELRIK